jgi:branched-chain amino acid transport system permease protein
VEQYIANGICEGTSYALVALGFGLIYTTTGVFHIAHGAIYTVGAYILYCCCILLNMPLPLASALALVGAALLGVFVEAVIYRPLTCKTASPTVLMISSLGVYIVVVNVIAMLLGNDTKILHPSVWPTVQLGGVILARAQITQFLIGLGVIVIYWLFLRKSPLGHICRAVADDSVLASVVGVRVERIRLLVFAIGSLLAGLGASLAALDIGIDPYIGFPALLVAAAACIAGGLHRFMAPALGALLLALIQSVVVWRMSVKWESAATFAILIGFLVFRPRGLMGIRQRLEER